MGIERIEAIFVWMPSHQMPLMEIIRGLFIHQFLGDHPKPFQLILICFHNLGLPDFPMVLPLETP